MNLINDRTCETLKVKYTNLFDLVNYSIEVAKNIIETERDPKVKSSIKNPSYNALEEIANNVDVIEPKKEKVIVEVEEKETEEVVEEKPKRKILKNLRTIDKS